MAGNPDQQEDALDEQYQEEVEDEVCDTCSDACFTSEKHICVVCLTLTQTTRTYSFKITQQMNFLVYYWCHKGSRGHSWWPEERGRGRGGGSI